MRHHHLTKFAFVAAALAASTAEAKPRRVVVMEFDGPRTLADTGRDAVVSVLGEQYDIVAPTRWEKARAQVTRTAHGPKGWLKASRQTGVDAVIDGWVAEEGRHKVLTLQIIEATTGQELEQVSVRLGKNGGVTAETHDKIKTGLDEVLNWVEGAPDVTGTLPLVRPEMVGAKRAAKDEPKPSEEPKKKAKVDEEDDDDEADADVKKSSAKSEDDESEEPAEKKPKPRPTEEVATASESKDLRDIFGPNSVEAETVTGVKANHVPQPSPRFSISAGGYYGTRNLNYEADGETQPYSAKGKGLQVDAAVYPFPQKKLDGGLSGIGFEFSLFHSVAGVVGGDTDEEVGNYQFNHHGWDIGIGWKQPLGVVSLSGKVGYGQEEYALSSDYPLEVPDTQYKFLYAGGGADLHITERASIGFGAKYFYVTGIGDQSDVEFWYGPGETAGFGLDGHFTIPLPARLFVKGELAYRRYKTELDGVGLITEEETVLSGVDNTFTSKLNIGIDF